jgi:hypothetical protein
MRVKNLINMMEQIPLVLGQKNFGPPTPENTTNYENEHVCHALQVEVVGEVTMGNCIICCEDYNVGKLIAQSSDSCHNKNAFYVGW